MENNSENTKTIEEPKPQAIPAPKVARTGHSFELFKDYTLPEWSATPTKDYL